MEFAVILFAFPVGQIENAQGFKSVQSYDSLNDCKAAIEELFVTDEHEQRNFGIDWLVRCGPAAD